MAEPATPTSLTGEKMGYGLVVDGTASLVRIVNPSVAGGAVNASGAMTVAGLTLHDAVDAASEGPVKIGGYAKATAPTAVSADADRVAAWFLLNGAQATVLTAAGALIGGDATRGLDVNLHPHTSGGLDTFNASGADGADTGVLTGTAVAVKASAGQLYGYYIFNPNDEASFVNFYNIAQGSVTVGSSNVKLQLTIPAGMAANVSLPHGVAFGTAITVSATKTAGSATNPDTGLDVQLYYK